MKPILGLIWSYNTKYQECKDIPNFFINEIGRKYTMRYLLKEQFKSIHKRRGYQERIYNIYYDIYQCKLYKTMSKKEIKKLNKLFYSSSTWINYKQEKIDRKETKKEAIRQERLTHNKSIDGLTSKERRRNRRREEDKLYGFE